MHRIVTLLALASLVLGCQHDTRTGNVHNVKIDLNEVSPAELTVGVGDEILFFNGRTQPVRVILIEGGRSIACQRGFAGRVDQEALINPEGTASFCFEKAGTFKYMVRAQGVFEGAESVLPGPFIIRAAPRLPSQTVFLGNRTDLVCRVPRAQGLTRLIPSFTFVRAARAQEINSPRPSNCPLSPGRSPRPGRPPLVLHSNENSCIRSAIERGKMKTCPIGTLCHDLANHLTS
jgi:plastocyanin